MWMFSAALAIQWSKFFFAVANIEAHWQPLQLIYLCPFSNLHERRMRRTASMNGGRAFCLRLSSKVSWSTGSRFDCRNKKRRISRFFPFMDRSLWMLHDFCIFLQGFCTDSPFTSPSQLLFLVPVAVMVDGTTVKGKRQAPLVDRCRNVRRNVGTKADTTDLGINKNDVGRGIQSMVRFFQ